MAVGACFAFGACLRAPSDPAPSIGLTTSSSGEPIVVYGLCAGEFVKGLQVVEKVGDLVGDGNDRVLWKIVAPRRTTIDTFTVGVPPPGFDEVNRLAGPLPDRFSVLVESNKVSGAVAGRRDQLSSNQLRYAGRSVSRAEFDKTIAKDCP